MSGGAASGAVRVLVVEDQIEEAEALLPHLRAYGFETAHETRGDAAVDLILASRPDAVVLDLGLPGKDGAEVCRAVRADYEGVIVALTKRGHPLDHILALESGADDFLPKPVDPPILLAHLKAALRRRRAEDASPEAGPWCLRFGRLCLDPRARSVSLGHEEIGLTTSEFDLLLLLARRAGEVVTRSDIRCELRGLGDGAIDRSMDMRVSRLRRLLNDDPVAPRRIKTVRGRGYLFNPAAWA